MKTTKILLILAALIALTSCDIANKEPLKGSIDRTGKPIVTTVYFYDSVEDVQRKYREIHDVPRDQKIGQVGFARWAEYRDAQGRPVENGDEPLTCEIHTVRPQQIDDSATLTLGHEMLHCVIGSYHPEK
jgi:hypothetical protein